MGERGRPGCTLLVGCIVRIREVPLTRNHSPSVPIPQRMAFLQEIEKKDPDARSKAEQSFLRRAREQNMIQEAHAE